METIIVSEKLNTKEVRKDSLRINEAGEGFLRTAAKWGKFIAVINFIVIGFVAAISLSLIVLDTPLQEYQDFSEYRLKIFGITYFITAIIFFFPTYFILRASSGIKKAFAERDENILSKAFESLKRLGLFTGILFIVLIIFVLFMLTGVVFFAGLMSM